MCRGWTRTTWCRSTCVVDEINETVWCGSERKDHGVQVKASVRVNVRHIV